MIAENLSLPPRPTLAGDTGNLRIYVRNYTDGYTGALSISSRAYLFEVVWNKGGETAANSALAELKTVSIQ